MRILLTGSSGFLGQYVKRELERREKYEIIAPASNAFPDSMDCRSVHCSAQINEIKPDVVVHLAAYVGGIGRNQKEPAQLWHDNLLMGLNVLQGCASPHSAFRARLILMGTTCSYPKTPKTIPFIEEELFDGFPEPTNSAYGIAKRSLHVGAQAYRSEFGLSFLTLCPTNLYGPGDHFDLESSHVIPALIRKFVEAKREKKKTVTLWGTGKPTRDFLYVEDCAQAIARAVERPEVDKVSLVNLGSGREISIARLASLVQRFVGYMGDIDWDLTKPDGQPRRVLDIQRAERWLDWKATTSLEEGLKKTVEWYVAQEAVKA